MNFQFLITIVLFRNVDSKPFSDLLLYLKNLPSTPVKQEPGNLLLIGNAPVRVRLMATKQLRDNPDTFADSGDNHDDIILHEAVWRNYPIAVKSRLSSLLGLNRKVHGRSCKVERITQQEADQLLNTWHTLGSVNAPFRYVLKNKDHILAVALFSKSRNLSRRNPPLRSAELLRFASAPGITVTGGLHKLIHAFLKERPVDHLMTYIDLDWGGGNGFRHIGFHASGVIEPKLFRVDPTTMKECADVEAHTENYYYRNRGSLKLEMFCKTASPHEL